MIAVLLALAILGVAFLATSILRTAAPGPVEAHPWLEQLVLKTTLAGLSILAMRLTTGGTANSGFRRPVSKVRWFPVWAPALGMGAVATLLVLLAGSHGLNSVFGSYGILGIIFWIWFYSSVTEEIYTRGWFQTYFTQHGGNGVVASAILFGAMHLSLLRKVDPIAVTVIVVSATILGYIAGTLRQKYQSLLPAVIAHVMFNVGGALGGVLYTITYRIRTGHLPIQ